MEIAANTRRVNTTLAPWDRGSVRRTQGVNTSLQTTVAQKQTAVTADSARTAHVKPTQHEQLVKQTQTWVAQTFFGTMLKQMRNSPFKSEIFSGGRGGEAFASMFDQQLAERMATGSGAKLVSSIVHQIESRAAAVKQQVEQKSQPGPRIPAASKAQTPGRKAA